MKHLVCGAQFQKISFGIPICTIHVEGLTTGVSVGILLKYQLTVHIEDGNVAGLVGFGNDDPKIVIDWIGHHAQ